MLVSASGCTGVSGTCFCTCYSSGLAIASRRPSAPLLMHFMSMIDTFDGNDHCPQTLLLHLLVERARGVSSFWAPFVARLPDQVFE